MFYVNVQLQVGAALKVLHAERTRERHLLLRRDRGEGRGGQVEVGSVDVLLQLGRRRLLHATDRALGHPGVDEGAADPGAGQSVPSVQLIEVEGELSTGGRSLVAGAPSLAVRRAQVGVIVIVIIVLHRDHRHMIVHRGVACSAFSENAVD